MAQSPSEPTSSPRVRILLVDDDEDDFILTREVVADIPGDGYVIEWESDFDTALDRICGNEFDVHLVDFRLGRKTGLDLLAALRERQCNGPVILLTGVGQLEIDRAAEAAGAADFLEKSRLDPVILERSIRYALRHRAQELELEQKVAKRTAELAAVNAALREADRRKDEFLGTLAHELRNPLAPVRNAIEIMRMQADNPAGMETARQMIERQVKHMVRLVDDLLDASRITRDKLRIELTRLDLGEPLRAAVEATHPAFTAGDLTFDLRLPEVPLPVNGDHVRLTQLFSNLLANAAKYTEPGGSVVLAVEPACSHVLVRVTDTGVGIPPDMLPRVFDLFAQVDHSLHRSHGGLGIGLALVKRLTEMHGGRVTAHSDGPGRGAEFVVSLPLIGMADTTGCLEPK